MKGSQMLGLRHLMTPCIPRRLPLGSLGGPWFAKPGGRGRDKEQGEAKRGQTEDAAFTYCAVA